MGVERKVMTSDPPMQGKADMIRYQYTRFYIVDSDTDTDILYYNDSYEVVTVMLYFINLLYIGTTKYINNNG